MLPFFCHWTQTVQGLLKSKSKVLGFVDAQCLNISYQNNEISFITKVNDLELT